MPKKKNINVDELQKLKEKVNGKKYITYFDLYGKVTLRKLQYVRKAEAQASLLRFIKKNLGKKY